MGRSPCCDKVGLKKGPWTPEEDQKLLAFIQEHGHGSWRALPPKAGKYLRKNLCEPGQFTSRELFFFKYYYCYAYILLLLLHYEVSCLKDQVQHVYITVTLENESSHETLIYRRFTLYQGRIYNFVSESLENNAITYTRGIRPVSPVG